MKSDFRKFLLVSALALFLPVGGHAYGDESAPAVPPDGQGIAPSTAFRFSSSGLGRTGDFAGTIVDLSCARCDSAEHHFALQLDDERTLYPLLLIGGPPIIDRLRAGEFTSKKVRISGVYYSSMGTILVGDIHTLG
jgi:hypothetical protein